MKKVAVTIIICLIVLTGCTNTKTLEEVIKEDNYMIVDVRTNEEYNEGHVKDSINIPYDEINNKTTLDKNKTIIVYCRSGRRSSIAKETLEKMGYNVLDLGSYDSITLEKE